MVKISLRANGSWSVRAPTQAVLLGDPAPAASQTVCLDRSTNSSEDIRTGDPILGIEFVDPPQVDQTLEDAGTPSLIDRLGIGAASHFVSLLTMRAPLR